MEEWRELTQKIKTMRFRQKDDENNSAYENLLRQRRVILESAEGKINKLDELGVAEETLVIFFSDNGSAWSANAPFRDKKGSRFEGGLRVPLIVSWAKSNTHHPMQKNLAIPAKSVEHDVVTCVDLMPTMLKIAGAKIPKDAVIDGFDISPYFTATEGTHRPQEFLTHFPHRHRNTLFSTYRRKNWKII